MGCDVITSVSIFCMQWNSLCLKDTFISSVVPHIPPHPPSIKQAQKQQECHRGAAHSGALLILMNAWQRLTVWGRQRNTGLFNRWASGSWVLHQRPTLFSKSWWGKETPYSQSAEFLHTACHKLICLQGFCNECVDVYKLGCVSYVKL